MPQGEEFKTTVTITLQELYRCRGIDGFNDLLEDKLGHLYVNASWRIVDHKADSIALEVTGHIETFDGDDAEEGASR